MAKLTEEQFTKHLKSTVHPDVLGQLKPEDITRTLQYINDALETERNPSRGGHGR